MDLLSLHPFGLDAVGALHILRLETGLVFDQSDDRLRGTLGFDGLGLNHEKGGSQGSSDEQDNDEGDHNDAVGGQAKIVAAKDDHHGQTGTVDALVDDQVGVGVYIRFSGDPDIYAYRHDEVSALASEQRPERNQTANQSSRAPSEVSSSQLDADWYDDPNGSGGERYWTGQTWTKITRATAISTAVPQPPFEMSSTPTTVEHVRPDWYDDPDGSGGQRWWDGQAWTRQRRPRDPSTRNVRIEEVVMQSPQRPGWYPDPTSAGTERYWDGSQWTSARPLALIGAAASQPSGPWDEIRDSWRRATRGFRIAVISAAVIICSGAVLLGIIGVGTSHYSRDEGSYQKGYHSGRSGVARTMYEKGLTPQSACKQALPFEDLFGDEGSHLVRDDYLDGCRAGLGV